MEKDFLNINENDYLDYLSDSIKAVKDAYAAYKKDDTDWNYWDLKRAVYYFSCDLKASDVTSVCDPATINELRKKPGMF